jgi:hypothetical protein
MIFFKFDSNESEDLVHEVLLVKVREAVNQNHNQLDEGINKSVI